MDEPLKETLADAWKILTSPSPRRIDSLAAHARGKYVVCFGLFELVIAFNYIIPAIILLESVSPRNMLEAVVFLPIGVLVWAYSIHILSRRVFKAQADHHEEILYVLFLSLIASTFLSTCLVILPWIGYILGWFAILYGLFLAIYGVWVITRMPVLKVVIVVMASLLSSIAVLLFLIPFVNQFMFRLTDP